MKFIIFLLLLIVISELDHISKSIDSIRLEMKYGGAHE